MYKGASTAHREEVDDLIIGVRERVTRFVLGQDSEQLDALENRAGNKGLNSETWPHKSEVQPTQQRILEAEHQNLHQNKIPDIYPREHNLNNIEYPWNNRNNSAYKMSAQESVNTQLHTNYPVHTYENANILPQH